MSDATLGVNKVTLQTSDVLESFDTEYLNYVQGARYHDGKIIAAAVVVVVVAIGLLIYFL